MNSLIETLQLDLRFKTNIENHATIEKKRKRLQLCPPTGY